MKLHALRWLALVAAFGLTACADPFFASCEERGERYCDSGGGQGEYWEFRSSTMTTSDVVVEPAAGGGFTAKQIQTFTNPFDWATLAGFDVAVSAGSVSSVPSPSSDYQMQITLAATAPTAEQARAALAAMQTEHGEQIGDDAYRVRHHVDFPTDDEAQRTADIVMALPSRFSYWLDVYTGDGDVSSSGLHGAGARLGIGAAGNVALSGTWEQADVNAYAGTVTVNADVASLTGYVDTGTLSVAVPGTRTAEISAESYDGDVDVAVGHAATTVFDLEGDTVVGGVTISVEGTEPVGAQTAVQGHYRSPGYDGGKPQVHVAGGTTFGDVHIHD